MTVPSQLLFFSKQGASHYKAKSSCGSLCTVSDDLHRHIVVVWMVDISWQSTQKFYVGHSHWRFYMLPMWAQNDRLSRRNNTSYKVLYHTVQKELPTYYLLGLWSCHMLCSSLLHSPAQDHIALLSHWSIWGKQAKSNMCFTSLTIRFSVQDWHMTTLHNRVHFITVTRLYPASLKSLIAEWTHFFLCLLSY